MCQHCPLDYGYRLIIREKTEIHKMVDKFCGKPVWKPVVFLFVGGNSEKTGLKLRIFQESPYQKKIVSGKYCGKNGFRTESDQERNFKYEIMRICR